MPRLWLTFACLVGFRSVVSTRPRSGAVTAVLANDNLAGSGELHSENKEENTAAVDANDNLTGFPFGSSKSKSSAADNILEKYEHLPNTLPGVATPTGWTKQAGCKGDNPGFMGLMPSAEGENKCAHKCDRQPNCVGFFSRTQHGCYKDGGSQAAKITDQCKACCWLIMNVQPTADMITQDGTRIRSRLAGSPTESSAEYLLAYKQTFLSQVMDVVDQDTAQKMRSKCTALGGQRQLVPKAALGFPEAWTIGDGAHQKTWAGGLMQSLSDGNYAACWAVGNAANNNPDKTDGFCMFIKQLRGGPLDLEWFREKGVISGSEDERAVSAKCNVDFGSI